VLGAEMGAATLRPVEFEDDDGAGSMLPARSSSTRLSRTCRSR
jgi:hypothetical protein